MKVISRRFRSHLVTLAYVAAYVATFTLAYVRVLSPTWSYQGFVFQPASPMLVVLGFVLAMAPALWMPVDLTRPSQLVYWILYVVVIIPASLVPSWVPSPDPGGMAMFQVALVVAFICVGIAH